MVERRCRGDLVVARWYYRVMLMTVLLRQCWSWHDVVAESYWRCRYRDDLATVRCLCQVMLVMILPSHASDGTTEMT
jgi:hypothetical protein